LFANTCGLRYPYVQITGPRLPVRLTGGIDCDLWWNEVEPDEEGRLVATGHRIADVVATAPTLDEPISRAYENIGKIRCVASCFRTDIGRMLWPPGSE